VFPDTPTVVELIDDPRDASVMKLIVVGSAIGRAFIAPPGAPPDRIAALRDAFDKMTRDPEFIAESVKRGFEVEPMTGAELQKMVADAMSVTEDVAQRTRDVTRLDGVN
jgi:tripartite-type tricarboxylate transporter receptor subunit TctC